MSKNKQLTATLNEAQRLIALTVAKAKAQKVSASVARKPVAKPAFGKKPAKVSAKSNAMTPKLNKIAKLIEKNVLTEADLIGAIGEVCRENKMSSRLALALTEAISKALDALLSVDDDVLDV